MTTTIRLAIGSIFVGTLVLAIKTLAWWLTGSVALFSDALESTVNVATAVAALIAIRIAARPADTSHPYGHHKAEFFSAVLEGVMIIVAALLILREAYDGFMNPVALDLPIEGLLINGAATVINAVWAWILVSRGRSARSPALVADGKHLFTDVVTSAGVALGVIASKYALRSSVSLYVTSKQALPQRSFCSGPPLRGSNHRTGNVPLTPARLRVVVPPFFR